MNTTLELNAPWRERLAAWLERPRFQYLITTLILINAVILGLETAPALMQRWGHVLRLLDQLILGCFVIEILSATAKYKIRAVENTEATREITRANAREKSRSLKVMMMSPDAIRRM